MSAFCRYIGIDYSGAETPEASLKGVRVYCAVGESAANEVPPPPSPRKYWTRRGIAHWLAERLAEDVPTIVGIDHGFSFPLRYLDVNRSRKVASGRIACKPAPMLVLRTLTVKMTVKVRGAASGALQINSTCSN